MVDLSQSRALKRGGFARDRRTGAVVKVAEQGGRDWMVKPAYKTDGYWAAPADLVPVRDPHEWGWKQAVALLFALLAGAWVAYGHYADLTDHGFSGGDAFFSSVPGGIIAVWIVRVISRNIRP